jgi:hypothetical protein
MTARALPLLGALALGCGLATACFSAWAPRPAGAQSRSTSLGTLPIPTGLTVASPNNPTPQPLQIQALDAERFVVATREPRLVHDLRAPSNQAQNMIVTVVTHYTVRGDRLIPVEHVRVPLGYRLVVVDSE